MPAADVAGDLRGAQLLGLGRAWRLRGWKTPSPGPSSRGSAVTTGQILGRCRHAGAPGRAPGDPAGAPGRGTRGTDVYAMVLPLPTLGLRNVVFLWVLFSVALHGVPV